MRVIRHSSLVAKPWKNGGGETREITCFPPGSSLDDFAWRLSTASVAQDGPFSIFDGIDRRLYVLQGGGLTLRFDTSEVHRIGADNHLDFRGEDSVFGSLVNGPVVDFNIMARRNRQRAHIEERIVAGPERIALPWAVAVIFVRHGQLNSADTSSSLTANTFDTLMLEDGHAPEVALEGDAEIILIGFDPV